VTTKIVPAPPRTVLITGCASGIGLATARRFAEVGDTVIASVRDLGCAEALRDRLAPFAARTEIIELDVTTDCADRVIADVVERYGGIDVLINNAGRSMEDTLEDLSLEDIQAALDVNFLGVARVTKAVLPGMRLAGSGRIIAVSSIGGLRGTPFGDAYCAVKFALEGLYECLAPVAAVHGVHLTLVEPGPVTGEFVTKESATVRGPSPEYAGMYDRFISMRSGAYANAPKPDYIAAVILDVSTSKEPPRRVQDSDASTRSIAAKVKDVDGRRVAAVGAIPGQDLRVVAPSIHEDKEISRVRILLWENALYQDQQSQERLTHIGGLGIGEDPLRFLMPSHPLPPPAQHDAAGKNEFK